MADGISQDELDALFGGEPSAGSDLDLAAVSALLDAFLERGLGVCPVLLGQTATVGPVLLTAVAADELPAKLQPEPLGITLPFTQGGQGALVLVIPLTLAEAMVGWLLGDPPAQWGEASRDALAEVIGQVAATGLNAASERLGGQMLAFGPAEVNPPGAPSLPDGELLLAEFTLGFGADAIGQCALLLSTSTAQSLQPPSAPAAPVSTPVSIATQAPPPRGAPAPRQAPAPRAPAVPAGGAVPMQLPELGVATAGADAHNLDLIMDVTLQVTVELGRTKKQIREVLGLGPGSVLELDKLAGEAVDVLVNGKLIARGEVVVIDENFGVRITDIVSPAERAASLR